MDGITRCSMNLVLRSCPGEGGGTGNCRDVSEYTLGVGGRSRSSVGAEDFETELSRREGGCSFASGADLPLSVLAPGPSDPSVLIEDIELSPVDGMGGRSGLVGSSEVPGAPSFGCEAERAVARSSTPCHPRARWPDASCKPSNRGARFRSDMLEQWRSSA